MHIHNHLCSLARGITDAAPRGPGTPEQWWQQRPHRVKQYYEMMGLTDLPPTEQRPPVKATTTRVLKRKEYRVENLHFQSMPRLYIAGNLYVPTGRIRERMPAVLYLCGHSESPRAYYQAHLRRFAQLGFVALAIDTIHLGELEGYHHGLFQEGWWHWYSRGYTPAGVELFNAIRAIDFLQSLPYVDGDRIGVTGISGGGATSWWLAAGDERIACVAPVCATGTFASQVIDRTIDGQCDCMFPINTYGWDLIDIAALVAPRPCLIASADCDRIFTIASIREFHERLKRVYDMTGASDNLALVETRGRHTYRKRSRTAVFSWFLKHLSGVEIPPSEVGDVDPEKDEPDQVLQVFTIGAPPGEITTTIHDRFIKLAEPPIITDAASLSRHRDAVIAALREKTFAHFPRKAAQLDLRVEFKWALEDRDGISFSFVSEGDYRLWANLIIRDEASNPGPAMVMIQNAGDKSSKTGAFRDVLPNWLQANIEVRGSGRTNWGQELQWHLRRAAMLTGRTIASMRVWDTLRALAAVRKLPEVDARRIALAGSGEMAVVALYAALLDGKIDAVILHNPPATQDAPSNPQGIGDSIEMLNCLRITDLPQVAGLLFPAELVFLGPRPSSYLWAEDLFFELGGRVRHVKVS
ncbi:MAG TPA: acetylxylan esterase [Blastocatellia bacterium]|nr:acetylxylan esterase [Blastocatellia bacterium]